MRLVRSLQFESFQTLTRLSQPHVTIIGPIGDGENRTHETHSEWPSSWMVYLHSPRVFHSFTVLSREPDTIWRLSAEKATDSTSFLWPTKRRAVVPLRMSHRRRVPSHDPESANWPSELMTTSCTMCEWPSRVRCGTPYEFSSSPL